MEGLGERMKAVCQAGGSKHGGRASATGNLNPRLLAEQGPMPCIFSAVIGHYLCIPYPSF